MAAYLSLAEFNAKYAEPAVKERANAEQKEAALEAVSREADSYLRSGGYDTPLAPELAADESLKAHLAAVVNFSLTSTLGLISESAEKSSVYLTAKEARRWLEGLATGRVSLTRPDADSATEYPWPTSLGGGSDPKRGW